MELFASIKAENALPIRIANFIALITVFLVNGLVGSGAVGGVNTGQAAARYPTFFTPASYAFSIWGLIYFNLAVWGFYQLFPRTFKSPLQNTGVSFWFLPNAVFNVMWVCVWQADLMYLSLIAMLGLLFTLCVVYYRQLDYVKQSTYTEYLTSILPFKMYLGWVMLATVVNIMCASTNTTDTKYVSASIVCLILSLFAEGVVGAVNADPVLPLVGCWATIAIAVNWRQQQPSIYNTAVGVAVVLGIEAIVILAYLVRRNVQQKRKSSSQESIDAINA